MKQNSQMAVTSANTIEKCTINFNPQRNSMSGYFYFTVIPPEFISRVTCGSSIRLVFDYVSWYTAVYSYYSLLSTHVALLRIGETETIVGTDITTRLSTPAFAK